MAFCSHCGEPTHDDAAFCTTCGKPVHKEAPSPQPEAPAAADQSPNAVPPSATPPPAVAPPPSSPPPTAAVETAAPPSTSKRPVLIGSIAAAVVGVVAVAAWFGLQQSSSADSGGVAIVAATTTTTDSDASAPAPTTTRPVATTSTTTTNAPTTTTPPPTTTTTTLPADLISSLETTGVFVESGSSADPAGLQETVEQAREQGFGLSVVAVAAEPSGGYSPYAGTIATKLNAETVVAVGPSGLGWASQESDFYQEEFERAWSLIPAGSTENGAVASFVRSVLGGPDSVGVTDLNAAIWLLLRFDGTPTEFPFGDAGDLPLAGDWTCDGIATPATFRPSTGQYFLRSSATSGAGEWNYVVDLPGHWPLAGDFDGDTCATIAYYDLVRSKVVIFNQWPENGETASADATFPFGDDGDIPFVGDFDGDGVDSIGLFRPSTGTFYLKNTHTEGPADIEFAFGADGDIPIAGDWGVEDGIDTVAVYRPSTGTFHFRYDNSAGPADETLEFGVLDGYPVAGAFGLERSN